MIYYGIKNKKTGKMIDWWSMTQVNFITKGTKGKKHLLKLIKDMKHLSLVKLNVEIV
jgi:hypothetical protein